MHIHAGEVISRRGGEMPQVRSFIQRFYNAHLFYLSKAKPQCPSYLFPSSIFMPSSDFQPSADTAVLCLL